MKQIKFLIILAITTFVIFSCEKEQFAEPKMEELDSSQTEKVKQTKSDKQINKLLTSLQKEDYENNHYLKSTQGARNGQNYIPPYEVQQKMLALILEQNAENLS